MPTVEWFEKRIIERMIERSHKGTYELNNKLNFFKSFRRDGSDPNLEIAFNNLIERRLLLQITLDHFILGTYKNIDELRRIKNIEPIRDDA